MISEEQAENATVDACGNALDQVELPMILMILMKAVRQKPKWSMNLPPGAVIQMTAKASMTTQNSYQED